MGWLDFIFIQPIFLNEGSVYELCVEGVSNYQDTISIGTSGVSRAGTSHVYDIDGTTNSLIPNTWYYTNYTPMVRGLMGQNPTPYSWDCINDACVDPGDGSGEYDSLDDCNQDCDFSTVWINW